MPFIAVRITREGVTAEQKRRVIAEITDTICQVLKKRPEHTHVVIEEIDLDNWGFAGKTGTEHKKASNRLERSSPAGHYCWT